MNFKKLREEIGITRNAVAHLINYKESRARWIEENLDTNLFLNYIILYALLFNVTIEYLLGITNTHRYLDKEERKRLITKLNIDEEKLNIFQKSYLNKNFIDAIGIENVELKMDYKDLENYDKVFISKVFMDTEIPNENPFRSSLKPSFFNCSNSFLYNVLSLIN